MARITLALCLLALTPWNAIGQTVQQRDLVQELLVFPAPSPQSNESRPQGGAARFSWDSPPPEDAPLDVLGLYWGQINDSVKMSASLKTRERLVEACVAKPEFTASLLKLLPQTPQVQNVIKRLYDDNGERLGEGWRDDVKKYLKLNSRYFREELVADAMAAKDDRETGSVTHEDELTTLARLDWSRAEPVLSNFAQAPMPRRAVLAKTLLYLHYEGNNPKVEALFADLKKTVEDRKALGYSRDKAADALLSVNWSGRDQWFLTLFSDPTLRNLHDGFYLRMPLVSNVGGDPDHWIPIVTKLIANSDRPVHDNAVECLIHFQLANARRDALMPLLPWLSDPNWSSASARLRLIQSVDTLDVPISIGQYLAEREAPSEGTMAILLSGATALESSDPQISDLLRDIVHRWPSTIGDRDIAQRIQSHSAPARSVAYALLRRDSFRKNCVNAIAVSASLSGAPGGIFAVLAGNQYREAQILKGSDDAAIQSLLASARLVREPLPFDQVERIYNSGDTRLEQVAGAYLTAEDSSRARQIFSSKAKGLVIVGARQAGGDPGHHSYTDFDKRESELLSLMSGKDAYDEAFALLSAGYWGDAGQIVIGSRGDTSTITFYDDPARRYRRTLRAEEVKGVTNIIKSEKVDDLGPLSQTVFDGMQYEYVHLTKNQGRRVFMNNPGESDSGGSVYDRLCGSFHKLLRDAPLTIEYPDLANLPGFEVLIADERFRVLNYWKEGTEERLRIYLTRNRGSAAVVISTPGRARAISRVPKPEGLKWVSIKNGPIETTRRPAVFPSEDPHSVVPDKFQKDNEDRQPPGLWALTQGPATYRAGEFRGKEGFWKFQAGKEPTLLAEDVFSPAISGDGKWAILAKRNGSSNNTFVIVRMNLGSGAMMPVDVPEADRLYAIVYIADQKRFFVGRVKDPEQGCHEPVGPGKPEYWLVNAETGHANIASEEIRPFTHVGSRPLQSTGDLNQYWAAIPNELGNGTDIGRFDARSSQFTSLLHVPALQFNSQAIWVDAPAKSIYITYKSHLLRASLP